MGRARGDKKKWRDMVLGLITCLGVGVDFVVFRDSGSGIYYGTPNFRGVFTAGKANGWILEFFNHHGTGVSIRSQIASNPRNKQPETTSLKTMESHKEELLRLSCSNRI